MIERVQVEGVDPIQSKLDKKGNDFFSRKIKISGPNIGSVSCYLNMYHYGFANAALPVSVGQTVYANMVQNGRFWNIEAWDVDAPMGEPAITPSDIQSSPVQASAPSPWELQTVTARQLAESTLHPEADPSPPPAAEFTTTRERFNAEQWGMNRRTSVMTARDIAKDGEGVDDLLYASDQIFAWLQGQEVISEAMPEVKNIEELMKEARKRYGDLDFRAIWEVQENISEVTDFTEAWKAVVSHAKES
jgi:hypothetical protein